MDIVVAADFVSEAVTQEISVIRFAESQNLILNRMIKNRTISSDYRNDRTICYICEEKFTLALPHIRTGAENPTYASRCD